MEYAGHVVTNPFGKAGSAADGFHDGIDLRTAVGIALYVPVLMSVQVSNDWDAYGALMDLTGHWRGMQLKFRFAHLSARKFKTGDTVAAGTLVAFTGGAPGSPGAGNSQGPHLHFEIRLNGKLVDPEDYPGLINSIFNGGIEMTEKEIKQLIQFVTGQGYKRLGERFLNQVDDTTDTTAKSVLKQSSDAFAGAAQDMIDASQT